MCVSAYLLNVLALELGDQSGETLIISFDSNGLENALDVLCRRRRVTAEGEEKICCEVLHFGCCKAELSVMLSSEFVLKVDAPSGSQGAHIWLVVFGGNRRFNQFNRELGGD
jgi:hypothetical protein